MYRQSILIILLSFLFSACVDFIPEPHALKYQDKAFNELANLILSQDQIYEMDDFTRHFKSLNGISVRLNDREGDQDAQAAISWDPA